jgi:hypothetical protein
MQATWYERQGPAQNVLVVGTMADPQPGPGEVRIRVHALSSCSEKPRAHPERDDIRQRLSSLELASPAGGTHQSKLVLVLAVIVVLVAVVAGSMVAF